MATQPALTRHTMTLDPETRATFEALGDGNVSEGARKAASMVAGSMTSNPVLLDLRRIVDSWGHVEAVMPRKESA